MEESGSVLRKRIPLVLIVSFMAATVAFILIFEFVNLELIEIIYYLPD